MIRDDESSDDTISLASQESHDSTIFEDPTRLSLELKPYVKKALLQFRCKLQDAILGNHIYGRPSNIVAKSPDVKDDGAQVQEEDDIRNLSLWGVPLLPSKGHQGTDIIILKFLQAKDFKVNEAFEMFRKMLIWRKEYQIDKILDEELNKPELEEVAYMNDCVDKKRRPVCYMMFGAFKEHELYRKTFASEQTCKEFLRWRVQLMERCIQRLSFKEGGVDSIVQITDLKNSPGPGTKEMRLTCKKAFMLIQENYPDFICKNIFVNVPFWYYASHSVSTQLLNQRAKSKFIFARPSRVTKTLLKFIAPEHLPVQFGGLKRKDDDEFSPENQVLETLVEAGCIDSIQVPIREPGVTVVWDMTVVGLEVSYREEFVPDDDCSYRILIAQEKKLPRSVRNSFYINEPGMILLTIDNSTFKKKKVYYRLKIKPTPISYKAA